jgi:hypothetical protein
MESEALRKAHHMKQKQKGKGRAVRPGLLQRERGAVGVAEGWIDWLVW